jgi:hypothetical protein
LSHEDLSFKEVVILSKMQRRIIELFKSRPTDGRIDLGASGIAMKWRPEYEREDDKWYRAVAEMFRGRSMEQEDVAHIVLFSRRISRNEFQAHMEKILPRLIDIKGAKGETLVKGHWYGSRVMYADDKPRDSRYGMPLLVINEVSEVWPHCMILYFDSQDELYEYYKHPTHSNVRIDLYKSFDDRIETLLKALDEGKIAGKARDLVNEFIEKIVSEYIKRLDLMTPTPYANFKLVKAPGFAQYPSE